MKRQNAHVNEKVRGRLKLICLQVFPGQPGEFKSSVNNAHENEDVCLCY